MKIPKINKKRGCGQPIQKNRLTDCHFRKGDSGVAELGEGEDEVVAEEEQEGSGDEQAPAEFVINSKLSVQHEVQIVEERRKT